MCVDLGKLLSVVLTGQRRFPGACALDVPPAVIGWLGGQGAAVWLATMQFTAVSSRSSAGATLCTPGQAA